MNRPAIAAVIAAALMAAVLAWEASHGGVVSHHLLAREDLPSVSNWWGLLTFPALAWFLMHRVERRLAGEPHTQGKVLAGFALALLFGAALSAFFRSSWPEMCGYMVLALPLVALAYPIYRAQCVLGFVTGMCFVFGPILPMIAATIFATAGALLYLIPRRLIALVGGRRSHA